MVESVLDPRADRFLRACRREPVDKTPIWMMRQAGRSLPAYRALRKQHGNIKQIARHPDIMAEITLLPLRQFPVDAAIMFADITLPLAGLGVEFDLVEDVGPVIEDPIHSIGQIEAMTSIPAVESVPDVLEAVKLVRKELEGVVPLIGFSGAPFTLAAYLIEGKPSRDFSKVKSLMFSEPAVWEGLMTRLTDMVIDYLEAQADAGIQAYQLFDSWVGALSPQDFERYVLPYTRRIFDETRRLAIPRIHFGTTTATLLELMSSVDCEVVGLDWRIPLDEGWAKVGFDKGVQGNLDPASLLAPPVLLKQRAIDVLDRAGSRPGHIFNLGHGVLPDSPVENLELLVEAVHGYGAR